MEQIPVTITKRDQLHTTEDRTGQIEHRISKAYAFQVLSDDGEKGQLLWRLE